MTDNKSDELRTGYRYLNVYLFAVAYMIWGANLGSAVYHHDLGLLAMSVACITILTCIAVVLVVIKLVTRK